MRGDIYIDPYCKGCVYYMKMGGDQMCCHYIFREDKPRPCPPGKECTVKKKRSKRNGK